MSFSQPQLEKHLSQSRHTCTHCQKLVVDPENSSKPVKRVNLARTGWIEFRNTFEYTVAELLRASQDACPVFERLVRSIEADLLRGARDGHRSVNIHLEITSSLSDKQGTAPNVKSVKIDCRWIDTDESLMDREAIQQNRYSFEAEVGTYRLMSKSHVFV
jgi:hypothetical protein